MLNQWFIFPLFCLLASININSNIFYRIRVLPPFTLFFSTSNAGLSINFLFESRFHPVFGFSLRAFSHFFFVFSIFPFTLFFGIFFGVLALYFALFFST